jgi:ATP-dependent Clp protease ATP-binding subunit ClpA
LSYFTNNLSAYSIDRIHLDLIANIADGLYVRDLENILRDFVYAITHNQAFSESTIRKLVNRYRIGAEDDPWTKLPLTDSPKALINSANLWFKERVIAQDYAVDEVVKAIKKARSGVVGLSSGQASKPKAVLFFAGPTGVGKTYLAKKLAHYLFDTEEAFSRFDMSEFKEEHTVSKLIGSPPGYVGYEKGGQLTNAVRSRPFAVILFDEIEKAHPKIMDIFLQILDDGRLTDSRGQTIFFTESVVVFTSNIGTRSTNSAGREINEKAKLEAILADSTNQESEKAN